MSAYDDIIRAAEAKRTIPPGLLAALFKHESDFNIDAVGDNGLARGIGQMHPAAALSVGGRWDDYFDKNVPDRERATAQINNAADYLVLCFRATGDWTWALAAYNQGPTAIARGLHYAETVLSLNGAK